MWVVGKHWYDPEIAAIIDATHEEADLVFTLQTLVDQDNVTIQVIVAVRAIDQKLEETISQLNLTYPTISIQLSEVKSARSAIETALEKAKGEFIAILASGDICDKTMFFRLY